MRRTLAVDPDGRADGDAERVGRERGRGGVHGDKARVEAGLAGGGVDERGARRGEGTLSVAGGDVSEFTRRENRGRDRRHGVGFGVELERDGVLGRGGQAVRRKGEAVETDGDPVVGLGERDGSHQGGGESDPAHGVDD